MGETLHGIKIYSPDQIEKSIGEYNIFVMTTKGYNEISKYLSEHGLVEGRDYFNWKLIFDFEYGKPSEMMRRTVYAKPLKDQPFCMSPFRKAHLHVSGDFRLCECPDYVDYPYGVIGNTRILPYSELWNSVKARIFRLSILNNTFCFCLEDRCDYMNPKRVEDDSVPRRKDPGVPDIPDILYIEADAACNLCCPSCRREPIFNYNNPNRENGFATAEKLIKSGWLEECKNICLAAYGEVFYSDIYKTILYPETEIRRGHIIIISNGILFNEAQFQSLKQYYERISCIVSCDGTTREVYEKLRPGANFEILRRNLYNLGEHRKNGEIEKIVINFVVQGANYKQMKDMVHFCEEIHADELHFIHIRDFGLYSEEEFEQMRIEDAEGNLKPEIMDVLRDPVFDSPIVSMEWFKSRMK